MGLKFFNFHPERYEVPISVAIFADGSGRIDINYNIFFATFPELPQPFIRLLISTRQLFCHLFIIRYEATQNCYTDY